MSPSPNHARASTLSSNILNVSCLSMPTVLTGIASSPPPLVLAGPAVTSPLLPLPRSIHAASLTSADASQFPVASSTSNQHRFNLLHRQHLLVVFGQPSPPLPSSRSAPNVTSPHRPACRSTRRAMSATRRRSRRTSSQWPTSSCGG